MSRIAVVNDVAGLAPTQVEVLRAAGYEAEFFDLPKPGGNWPWWAKMLTLPVRLLRTIPVLARVRGRRFDWLHINFVSQGIVGLLSGKPFVVQAHGSDLHLNLRLPVVRTVTRLVLQRARAILYVTPNLGAFLKGYEAKSYLVPNPVQAIFFDVGPAPARLQRILIFTRLDPVKGAERIFPAVERLASSVTLTAFDWGPLASEYRQRYARWVQFAPVIPHAGMPGMLGQFDAVIGQMEQGVLGLSELEALAAGRVVFMRLDPSAYPSAPPPVVSVGEPEELVAAVERLRARPDEVERLSRASRAWAFEHHSTAACARIMAGIYEAAAGPLPVRRPAG